MCRSATVSQVSDRVEDAQSGPAGLGGRNESHMVKERFTGFLRGPVVFIAIDLGLIADQDLRSHKPQGVAPHPTPQKIRNKGIFFF